MYTFFKFQQKSILGNIFCIYLLTMASNLKQNKLNCIKYSYNLFQ